MKQKLWTPLKKGDLVQIVAPGMSPKPQTLQGIAPFLKSWGLEVRINNDMLGRDLICANSRKARFKNLEEALIAPDAKMIWCLRGGYGSLQLLEPLEKLKPGPVKCFMGLSDITSLHNFMVQKWGWPTIHGCNIDRFALNMATASERARFKALLFGKTKVLTYKLKPLNLAAQKNRTLNASVVGGNLVTLQSGFGTRFQLETRGKILFLEDIGERAYRVDRILEHMRQLGLFKGLKAMVFGQFTGGKEPDGRNLIPKLLGQFATDQRFPVLKGLQSGHGSNQHPLPLGTNTKLKLGERAEIEIQSGANYLD